MASSVNWQAPDVEAEKKLEAGRKHCSKFKVGKFLVPIPVPNLGDWLHFAHLETLQPNRVFEDCTSPFYP